LKSINTRTDLFCQAACELGRDEQVEGNLPVLVEACRGLVEHEREVLHGLRPAWRAKGSNSKVEHEREVLHGLRPAWRAKGSNSKVEHEREVLHGLRPAYMYCLWELNAACVARIAR